MQELQNVRREHGWTQAAVAKRLAVSQGYVALLEQGRRQPSASLRRRMVAALGLPVTMLAPTDGGTPTGAALAADLATLGYPGFKHLGTARVRRNPAAVLLDALAAEQLEPRTAEALPWVLLAYPDLDWDWLLPRVKQSDLQNRLGFVVSLASALAEQHGLQAATGLRAREAMLERSRLVREDVFGRTVLTEAERRRLRVNRPDAARHWNVLSDLRPEHLSHAV
jgi:transcriptional regulator with XRE-family HTH domain